MTLNNVARIFAQNGGVAAAAATTTAAMLRFSMKPAMGLGLQHQRLFSSQGPQRMDPSSVATEQRYESESSDQPSEYALYVQDARDDLNSPNWGCEQIKNNSAEWQA
ncbi:stress responsive orphan 1 [Schizosaccharomyces octosporus yFS286]|uniref:Stress responsive orphan 1 n=1 Tax=Schizosaccharomyces octosporus (strain yFS286) TaxID=483514 RepID=S9PQ65_SCHOY|nr:stress responsive orphan 1 [Schizosaccharomyces octosporus yFS286]EPX71376.1 stress responsive orphan 1 [Schizosaccharomyces octosporus yFS286]